MKQYSRGKLLDCGCGEVPYFGIYGQFIKDNICIDWQNSLHNQNYIDQFADLNADIPFPDNCFDSILLADVLEHLFHPDKLLRELSRILKPGGALMVFVPFMYWIHEEPNDHFRFTEFALEMYCRDFGLEVLELSPYGGSFDVVADLFCKHIARSKSLAKIFTPLLLGLRQIPIIKKLNMKKARRFPLGYALVAQKLK